MILSIEKVMLDTFLKFIIYEIFARNSPSLPDLILIIINPGFTDANCEKVVELLAVILSPGSSWFAITDSFSGPEGQTSYISN